MNQMKSNTDASFYLAPSRVRICTIIRLSHTHTRHNVITIRNVNEKHTGLWCDINNQRETGNGATVAHEINSLKMDEKIHLCSHIIIINISATVLGFFGAIFLFGATAAEYCWMWCCWCTSICL